MNRIEAYALANSSNSSRLFESNSEKFFPIIIEGYPVKSFNSSSSIFKISQMEHPHIPSIF